MLMDAGVANVRIELTDQPASVVTPLLERYAAALRAEATAEQLMAWLDRHVVDSTGHAPGVTTGSLRPAAERKWASLRKTAAEERANAAARE
jgi:hypothetical protein